MLPFSKALELCHDLDGHENANSNAPHLPGRPYIGLQDVESVSNLLANELYAHDLETIAPRLWIMTTSSSANINALHRQEVKGRKIVITEQPRLHLVWIHDRIFIKPLPQYLLCHAFWNTYLTRLPKKRQTIIRGAALGYLRTYRYLIQHESDFNIAQQDHLRLVPDDVNWVSFCRFVSELDRIMDADVSGRYNYGELRLTRLNFYAPLFLRKFHFEQVHGQYSHFFARFYGPFLFVFAVMSIMLSALQVEMAMEQLGAPPRAWMRSIARWFSVVSVLSGIVVSVFFISLWLWIVTDEWVFTLRQRFGRRKRGTSAS